MHKLWKWLCVGLMSLCAQAAMAQVATVTATVVDSDSTAWVSPSGFSATYTIQLVGVKSGDPIPAGRAYRSDTGATITNTYTGNLSGSGALSVAITEVSFIRPTDVTWKFTVCPAVSNPICGSVLIAVNASGDVSSQINAAISAPRISGGPNSYAYADVEVAASPSNSYYNNSSAVGQRCYTTSWGACGGGGTGGGVTGTFDATKFSGATNAEKVNACLAAAIAVGGTCDASGFNDSGINPATGVITAASLDAGITAGNNNGNPVTLILPNHFWWDFTMTGGTACGLTAYSGVTIATKDPTVALPSLGVISPAAGSSLNAVLCVVASTGQSSGNYVTIGGFQVNNGQYTGHGAATASGAAVLINGSLADTSVFERLVAGSKLDTYVVEVEGGMCCSTTFNNIQINGLTVAIPLYFNQTTGNSLSAVNIVDSSIVHNPTGSPLILISDTAAHDSTINIVNLYSEVYTTTASTTGLLSIQGAGAVSVDGWTLKAYTSAMSSPAISTTTAANTSLIVRNLNFTNGSGSWVSTTNPISNGNVSSVLFDPRIDSGGHFQEYLYSPGTQNGTVGSLWSMGSLNGMQVYAWNTGNTALGNTVLPLTITGTDDTAVGNNVMPVVTSGSANTGVGFSTLAALTTGSDNTAYGYNAMKTITTGGNNTAVGYQAGQDGSTNVTNGNSSYFGYDAWCTANALSNDTVLGYQASCSASNEVVLGNSSVTDAYFGSESGAATLHGAKLALASARKGTFVCTAAGTITIANTTELATSDVVISMNTAGGTITTPPAMKTVTGGTGFTVLCGASDTSTYNYDILD